MGVDMSGVRSTISALSRAGHKARETLQGVDPVDFLVRALKYFFLMNLIILVMLNKLLLVVPFLKNLVYSILSYLSLSLCLVVIINSLLRVLRKKQKVN